MLSDDTVLAHMTLAELRDLSARIEPKAQELEAKALTLVKQATQSAIDRKLQAGGEKPSYRDPEFVLFESGSPMSLEHLLTKSAQEIWAQAAQLRAQIDWIADEIADRD